MNTTLAEKKSKENVVRKCWKFFDDNFHKFNQLNKIKIALALCTKDMPTQLEGDGFGTNIYNIINQIRRDIGKDNNSSVELDSVDGLYKRRTRPNESKKEVPGQGIPA